MVTLTLTINDNAEAQRLLDGYCIGSNYDPAGGLTKQDWVKKNLGEYLKLTALRGEFKESSDTITSELNAIVIT